MTRSIFLVLFFLHLIFVLHTLSTFYLYFVKIKETDCSTFFIIFYVFITNLRLSYVRRTYRLGPMYINPWAGHYWFFPFWLVIKILLKSGDHNWWDLVVSRLIILHRYLKISCFLENPEQFKWPHSLFGNLDAYQIDMHHRMGSCSLW